MKREIFTWDWYFLEARIPPLANDNSQKKEKGEGQKVHERNIGKSSF